MKVGILGSAIVAQTLGSGLLKYNHEVMLGSRTPEKLSDWQNNHPGSRTGTFFEAAAFGEIIILAVRGSAANAVLNLAEAANLEGKILIDATNPIAKEPPQNGVLRFFTDLNESLMEQLQKNFPKVKFVKAFNSVGNAAMVDPQFKDGKPTMFICGNDEHAKKQVSKILDQFGWEISDMGAVEAARAIEPLCILWCIPGFLQNSWTHAFKLLK